jgi:hypothetical protein
MVQNNLEMHRNWKLLLHTLETMLTKHKHSFSDVDLTLLHNKFNELVFYRQVIANKNCPNHFTEIIISEIDESFYILSTMLDKYSLEDNELGKIVSEFETQKLKIII